LWHELWDGIFFFPVKKDDSVYSYAKEDKRNIKALSLHLEKIRKALTIYTSSSSNPGTFPHKKGLLDLTHELGSRCSRLHLFIKFSWNNYVWMKQYLIHNGT